MLKTDKAKHAFAYKIPENMWKKKKRETDFQIRIHSKYFTMRLQMLLRFGTQYDLIVQNVSVL